MNRWQIITKRILQWPNIIVKGHAPDDAEDWDGKPNKWEEQFSAKPGEGK